MKKIILTSTALHKLIELLKKEIEFGLSKPRFRRIEKIDEKIFAITLHTKNGKLNLLIDIGKMLFSFGKLKIESSYTDRLTNFLNKKIKNAIISSIYQYNLDRIIIFEIEREQELRIIFELFGGGNLIITDLNGRILEVYREFETKKRVIKKKRVYEFPPDGFQKLVEMAKQNGSVSKKDLFRYAPFDPHTLNFLIKREKEEFHLEDLELISKKGADLIEESLVNDCIYILEEDEKLYIHPYPLRENDTKEICGVKEITRFLTQNILLKESRYEERMLKEKKKLERRIEELSAEKENVMEILNNMYSYIPELSEAFEKLRKGERVEKIGVYEIVKIDRKNKSIDLKKDGYIVKLRYDINPYSSISHAYDKIKSYEDAISNLKKRIEKLEIEIKKERERQEKKKIIERKTLSKKWFEKFVWSISTNGFLIVAGKDATTNEILIKKYMDDKDLIFHSEIHGSPFTLLKNGVEAESEDIFDAALITASYSRAWKIGISTVPVYYVKPEQVSKKAPSGEYIKKGGFMIYGKKSYVRGITLELYIGVISDGNVKKILVGSKRSILKNSINEQKKIYRLTQGKTSKSKIVDKIIADLIERGYLDPVYREEYVNDLMNRLPSGLYRIEIIDRKILEET